MTIVPLNLDRVSPHRNNVEWLNVRFDLSTLNRSFACVFINARSAGAKVAELKIGNGGFFVVIPND